MGISNCLGGNPGDAAESVLLLSSSVDVQYIAKNYLTDSFCYNEIRGMYGYTGNYKGKRVSVQGVGFGVPSQSIYLYDLIHDHGSKRFVKIGGCRGMKPELALGDTVLALSASYDNYLCVGEFGQMNFSPAATYSLLKSAYTLAGEQGVTPKVGSVFTTDLYYSNDPDFWRRWAQLGVLCVDMEAAGLYSYAAKFGTEALSILSVEESLVTGEKLSQSEQNRQLDKLAELALGLLA